MWCFYLLIFGLLCSTMVAQNLRLLSPNGSETISVDSEILIQWEGVQDSNLVKLEYSIDNGNNWNVIAIGRWSSYVWKDLPQTPSNQCLIRVQQLDARVTDSALTIFADSTRINQHSVSPNGNVVASVGYDSSIKIWDVHTGQLLSTILGHKAEVNQIVFSPDGTKLASASADNTVKIWDVASGQELRSLNVEHPNGIYNLAFSNDSKFLTSAGLETYIDYWDVNTGNRIDRIVDNNSVYCLKFSPDNQTLAYAKSDGEIKILYMPVQHVILTINAGNNRIHSMDYSPDGSMIAAGGLDKELKMFSTNTGVEVHQVKGFSAVVNDVDFSPNGEKLAFTTTDTIVRICDVFSGKVIRQLIGHTTGINKVNYAPNGKKLVTNSMNELIIWDIEENVLQEDQSDSIFSLVMTGTSVVENKRTAPKLNVNTLLNNDKVSIDLNLIEDGVSTVKIFNSNGFLMNSYSFTTSGSRTIEVDTKNYSNGLYFITIETPTQFDKAKLMLVR